MTRSTIVILVLMTVFLSSCVTRNPAPITQGELVRNSQEMFNAVASGDQAPWQKYFVSGIWEHNFWGGLSRMSSM